MSLVSLDKTSPLSVALHESVARQVMAIETAPGEPIVLSKKEVARIVESILSQFELHGYFAKVLEWFNDPLKGLFFGVSFGELRVIDLNRFTTDVASYYYVDQGDDSLDVKTNIEKRGSMARQTVYPSEIARITNYNDRGDTLFLYLLPEKEVFQRLDAMLLNLTNMRSGSNGPDQRIVRPRQARQYLSAVRASPSMARMSSSDYGSDVTSRFGRKDYESSIGRNELLPIIATTPQQRVAALILRFNFANAYHSERFAGAFDGRYVDVTARKELFESLGVPFSYEQDKGIPAKKVSLWLAGIENGSVYRASFLAVGYRPVDVADYFGQGILDEKEAEEWVDDKDIHLMPLQFKSCKKDPRLRVAFFLQHKFSDEYGDLPDIKLSWATDAIKEYDKRLFAFLGDEPSLHSVVRLICPEHENIKDISRAILVACGNSPSNLAHQALSDERAIEWMSSELSFVDPRQYEAATKSKRLAVAILLEKEVADDPERYLASLDQDMVRRIETLIGDRLPYVTGDYEDEGERSMRRAIVFVCPSYPKVFVLAAIRIARGETPVQLSNGVLTKKEAHEWLSSGMDDMYPVDWLLRNITIVPQGKVKSPLLARWLLAAEKRGGLGQLTRVRVQYGPRGQRMEFRFVDVIDHVTEADLVNGPNTTIEDAFQSASNRGGEEYARRFEEDFRSIGKEPAVWKLIPGARYLKTPSALVNEGREMKHCAGTYIRNVEEGYSAVVAMNLNGARSTFEVRIEDNVVTQHMGLNDKRPPQVCIEALEGMMVVNGWNYKEDCYR